MSLNWQKDLFINEREEFLRITKQYNDPKDVDEAMKALKETYRSSPPVLLSDGQWKKLQNSGSYSTTSISVLLNNLKRDGVKRNLSRLFTQFFGSGEVNSIDGLVKCPIILQFNDGQLELVGGNTRLSMARLLGVRPKVVIVKTDW